jgi:putative transposase
MEKIARTFTNYQFFGSYQIGAYLPANRFHSVQRLMQIMGLPAIYKSAGSSKKHAQHPVQPYLLRNLTITDPNRV